MAAPVRRRGPVGVFNALFGAASLPTSLREGMADYNLVKCYVLLHDLTTGPANSQAATDGLQVAAGLQRPPLWIALRRTHAMRAPCSPRGVGAPSRRPPPTARPPRPPLPPLSIAAPALHRCRRSPSLPPLSICRRRSRAPTAPRRASCYRSTRAPPARRRCQTSGRAHGHPRSTPPPTRPLRPPPRSSARCSRTRTWSRRAPRPPTPTPALDARP